MYLLQMNDIQRLPNHISFQILKENVFYKNNIYRTTTL